MFQRLHLPIDDCAFSAGYKNSAYYAQQGYTHYGVDLYSVSGDTRVCSPGNGIVISTGADGTASNEKLGNCLVVIYPSVRFPSGVTRGLACRMFHFDKIYVQAGQAVTAGQLLGEYGNTGSTTVNGKKMGKHLHIEFDTDVAYSQYAVGIKSSGKIIKKGTTDSTVNPSAVWWLGPTQSIQGIYLGWYSDDDISLRRDNFGDD